MLFQPFFYDGWLGTRVKKLYGRRKLIVQKLSLTMKTHASLHSSGSLPKIGIRPTIDGRLGGVRESLEKQTMDMARSAAKLISSSLRHPNGKRVECVIADTCIGGVAEAAACAENFRAKASAFRSP